MKALFFEQYGLPHEILALKDIPLPSMAKSHSLVKMLYASINPADHMFIQGQYGIKAQFPQIAGLDGVGLIHQSGGSLPAGTLVAFRYPGAWAEYALVPDHNLIPLPDDYPMEKATQLVLNAATAYGLLNTRQDPGEWLFLTAGSSTVAKLILQFAVKRKIQVACSIRAGEDGENLEKMGANLVVDSSNLSEMKTRIMDATNQQGISTCFDCVGGQLSTALFESMATGGRYIFYGALDNADITISAPQILFKQLTMQPFRFQNFLDSLDDIHLFYQQLIGLFGDPGIKVEINSSFSLEHYLDALQKRPGEKVLLRMT